MRSQLEKIALVNTSTLSETLTFSVVQEGADEASRQVISIEPASTPVIENSQIIISSKNYNLTVVGFFSASALSQLETWATARTDLTFVGYGIGGQILQMEGALNVNQGFDENASFRFTSPREATGGYSAVNGKHSAKTSYSTNGLALYKWGDANADGIADGWSKTGGTTSFASGSQTFSTTGVTAQQFEREVQFPFAGKTVYFNVNVSAITSTTGVSINIEAFNASDVSQGSATTAITTTGDKQVSLELPADTQYIEIDAEVGQDDSITFADPTLELDSTYNFVQFNT